MKKLLLPFFTLLSFICQSQTIIPPRSVYINANSAGADPGDFTISGFSSSAIILVGISLENYNSGTSLSFPINTGLTLSTGYTSFTSVTSLNFRGTQHDVNVALKAMTLTMGTVRSDVKINISAQEYDANYFYNPVNNHFYRFISGTVSYSKAKSDASNTTFKGKQGYLVTITSQNENDFISTNTTGNNIWIALTDVTTEGRWIIDAGPELGTVIKTANSGGNITGQYNNWCSGEPNDASGEDYAVTKWGGGSCWNDVSGTNTNILGYIIEFSEDFPTVTNFTGVYRSSVVLNGGSAVSIASGEFNNINTWDNSQNIPNGLTIQNNHTISIPDLVTRYSGSINFNGTGKLNLNNSGKWTPNPLQTSIRNCKDILFYYPLSKSGRYQIDPDGDGAGGVITCECDMETDGGGWTLVLNYLHKGNTNPVLNPRTSNLPLMGSSTLGTDESGTNFWGHAAPSYLNTFVFSELRFFGKTSNSHGRVIHFKTSHTETRTYFRTGTGSMSGIQSSHTLFPDHSAYLPNSARDFYSNQGNLAMTNFSFWLGGTYHWGIRGLDSRWEVDDFPGNSAFSTHHQLWIR